MEKRRAKSIIESMLFVWGEPLSLGKIASVLKKPAKETRLYIEELAMEYETQERGFRIVEANRTYQLSTSNDNHPYLESLCTQTRSKGLSQSSLEILAIIAYKQPITRAEIEQVRGVKSEKPLSTLIDRDLVEEKGRLEKIGRPIVYGTTNTFLTAFGFKSLRELPDIKDFHNIEFLMQVKLEDPQVNEKVEA